MPIKADRGSNLNQPQEIGAKHTQRSIDAWPEMDPNRPADGQTTGRESRAGSSIRGEGSARREAPLAPHGELELAEAAPPQASELRKEPGKQTKLSLRPGPRR